MDKQFLTLKDIAVTLNLPESTLRKYRDAYPQFIPTIGAGRDRCYRPEAVEVFKAIRRYRASEMMSWEDTAEHLAARFPLDSAAVPAEKKTAVPQPASAPEPPPPPPEPAGPLPIDIALEALQRIEGAADKHEFLLSTLASEIIKMKEMYKGFGEALSELGTVRRTLLALNNDVRALERERKSELYDMQSRTAQIQTSMRYIQRLLEKQAGVAPRAEKEILPLPPPPPREPAPPPAAAPADEAEARRLRELLKERNEEIHRIKNTNMRLLSEVEDMRKRLDEAARISQAPAPAGHSPAMPDEAHKTSVPAPVFSSGKFVFKGKKK